VAPGPPIAISARARPSNERPAATLYNSVTTVSTSVLRGKQWERSIAPRCAKCCRCEPCAGIATIELPPALRHAAALNSGAPPNHTDEPTASATQRFNLSEQSISSAELIATQPSRSARVLRRCV